jgi:hypothetical protein
MSFLLVFRRYAPFSKFGFGYEGDHRKTSSVSMHATARTIGIVPFARGFIGSLRSESSGTEYVGGGDRIRQFLGKKESKVSSTETDKHTSPNSISFTASTSGANPMVRKAPDIDTFVDFRAEWHGSGVRFSGAIRGDDFPNAEVFVLDARSRACLLFDGRTTGGQDTGPITRLAGSHESQGLGRFFCSMPLSPDGFFLHSKSLGPVTIMQPPKAGPAWSGGGGQSFGGGASGRY